MNYWKHAIISQYYVIIKVVVDTTHVYMMQKPPCKNKLQKRTCPSKIGITCFLGLDLLQIFVGQRTKKS